MVPPASNRISRVPLYSGFRSLLDSLAGTGISPSLSALSIAFPFARLSFPAVLQPHIAMVWALSLSLAATRKITFVFFSSSYLDVSVHRVVLHTSMDDWT